MTSFSVRPFVCRSRVVHLLSLGGFVVMSALNAHAETQLVDSLPALTAALNQALPGDTITLKNGVYTTSAAIQVNRPGAANLPITIAAESVGGVEIAGAYGFRVIEPAAHVVISGFKFTHAAGKNVIEDGTGNVRFTRNTFLCPGEGAYLTVSGDDVQVDHNDFAEKKSSGAMLAVSGTGAQVARRLWIHHNYFHDFDNDGTAGAEMIRFGLLSAHRLSNGAGLVEHNLFERCRGVNDLVSNRSSGNTYRYNTFSESPSSHLTIRQGNDCIIAANYFRKTEGIRLYGDRHQVLSNYLEGNYIGVNLGNGDVELADAADAPANSHDRPDDCVIAFNTFVDNATHFQMSRRTSGALGATHTTFSNNLLSGGKVVAKIDGPYPGAVWSGNLLTEDLNAGTLPSEGFTRTKSFLEAGPDGIKRSPAGSPAFGAATGEFPQVTYDLDGQTRPEKKSVGADEISTTPVVARWLTAENVGPKAQ